MVESKQSQTGALGSIGLAGAAAWSTGLPSAPSWEQRRPLLLLRAHLRTCLQTACACDERSIFKGEGGKLRERFPLSKHRLRRWRPFEAARKDVRAHHRVSAVISGWNAVPTRLPWRTATITWQSEEAGRVMKQNARGMNAANEQRCAEKGLTWEQASRKRCKARRKRRCEAAELRARGKLGLRCGRKKAT